MVVTRHIVGLTILSALSLAIPLEDALIARDADAVAEAILEAREPLGDRLETLERRIASYNDDSHGLVARDAFPEFEEILQTRSLDAREPKKSKKSKKSYQRAKRENKLIHRKLKAEFKLYKKSHKGASFKKFIRQLGPQLKKLRKSRRALRKRVKMLKSRNRKQKKRISAMNKKIKMYKAFSKKYASEFKTFKRKFNKKSKKIDEDEHEKRSAYADPEAWAQPEAYAYPQHDSDIFARTAYPEESEFDIYAREALAEAEAEAWAFPLNAEEAKKKKEEDERKKKEEEEKKKKKDEEEKKKKAEKKKAAEKKKGKGKNNDEEKDDDKEKEKEKSEEDSEDS